MINVPSYKTYRILIENGVDILTVSKRLGHSKISTTFDIYTHKLKKDDHGTGYVITSVRRQKVYEVFLQNPELVELINQEMKMPRKPRIILPACQKIKLVNHLHKQKRYQEVKGKSEYISVKYTMCSEYP